MHSSELPGDEDWKPRGKGSKHKKRYGIETIYNPSGPMAYLKKFSWFSWYMTERDRDTALEQARNKTPMMWNNKIIGGDKEYKPVER